VRGDELRIVIEHGVHISLGGKDYFETLCRNVSVPRLCDYRFPGLGRLEAEGAVDVCARIGRGFEAVRQWARERRDSAATPFVS
jgi:hypothetical protein